MNKNNFGLVRVCAASPKIQLANPAANAKIISEELKKADANKVSLLLLPELTITGKSCGNLFLQEQLYISQMSALDEITKATEKLSVCLILGLFVKICGKMLNCAAIIQNGEIKGIVPKMYTASVTEHKEDSFFAPGNLFSHKNSIYLQGKQIPFGQLIFCDSTSDINFGIEINDDLLAPICPSSGLALSGAQLIFNPSACAQTIGSNNRRKTIISATSAKNNCAYIYASAGEGESTQDMVFGGSCLISMNGNILSETDRFNSVNNDVYYDIDVQKINFDRLHVHTPENPDTLNLFYIHDRANIDSLYLLNEDDIPYQNYSMTPFIPEDESRKNEKLEEIFNIQSHALAQRLTSINAKTAVIGISGGLDSTLALLVTAKAFDIIGIPRSGIIAVTMPGFGTTDRTYQNALTIMKRLGTTVKEISIANAVRQHFKDIGHDESIHDTTYENAQARERTQILMDVANKESGIVVGTGDLSEAALGWCTFNGDHISMYNVNGGVPKTLVRLVVKWVMENKINDSVLRETLQEVLDTPISPELLPPDESGNISQKTEDNVGPYELHDFFIYYTLRYAMPPSKLLFAATNAFNGLYDREFIKKWLKVFYKRFFTQQFKRNCVPDGPKIGSVSLSPRGDWNMPSDAQFAAWMEETEKL